MHTIGILSIPDIKIVAYSFMLLYVCNMNEYAECTIILYMIIHICHLNADTAILSDFTPSLVYPPIQREKSRKTRYMTLRQISAFFVPLLRHIDLNQFSSIDRPIISS